MAREEDELYQKFSSDEHGMLSALCMCAISFSFFLFSTFCFLGSFSMHQNTCKISYKIIILNQLVYKLLKLHLRCPKLYSNSGIESLHFRLISLKEFHYIKMGPLLMLVWFHHTEHLVMPDPLVSHLQSRMEKLIKIIIFEVSSLE